MISTGVVRKIDDLGRIVIPKEIRKSLGIRDGENLEITVEDSNIRLTKNNIINKYLSDIKELFGAAESFFSGSIILTDREKVILTSNDKLINEGDKLSNELIKMIDNRTTYNDSNILKLTIGSKEFIGNFLIYPIIDEGNSIGLIILFNDGQTIKEYNILAKYLSVLVAKKIDITS